MMKIFLIIIGVTILTSCASTKGDLSTQGDPNRANDSGYQPIDPLPVSFTEAYGLVGGGEKLNISNKRIMASLPDETMRLAITEINNNQKVSYTAAELGRKDRSYIVVLDYIKFDTQSLPLFVERDAGNSITNIQITKKGSISPAPNSIVPMYIGVGIRFTATIKVNEGKVDLGNLFAIGLAAEAKKVTGTIVIQTLGLSGKDISSLIPMPSQINTTSIQNAMMSLASIKSKMYDDSISINPRVVGFYNNLGGGAETVNKFIENVLSKGVTHHIR